MFKSHGTNIKQTKIQTNFNNIQNVTVLEGDLSLTYKNDSYLHQRAHLNDKGLHYIYFSTGSITLVVSGNTEDTQNNFMFFLNV